MNHVFLLLFLPGMPLIDVSGESTARQVDRSSFSSRSVPQFLLRREAYAASACAAGQSPINRQTKKILTPESTG